MERRLESFRVGHHRPARHLQPHPDQIHDGKLSSLAVSTDIRYLPLVRYEWDDRKAALNFRKHDVDFEDAIVALEDPNRVEEVDTRFVYDEERIQIIGMAHSRVLFVIVMLPGEDACRIISARKATRHEQDRYYASNHETW